ncbi:putative holin-like toxin [Dellaglioa carnosa]|nr:putative holin-like toxin [Dellaglioa carnosa]MCZ2493100.1 putative holin-like toxin [Dellaglioa carnosa]
MSVFDALQLMLGFGTFIVSFLGLVVFIVKLGQKK